MNLEHQNLCNCCNNPLEKFLEKESKKPKNKGEKELCNGTTTMSNRLSINAKYTITEIRTLCKIC
jgi:hypothetical protein